MKRGQDGRVGNGLYGQSGQRPDLLPDDPPEEPMPRMHVGWAFSDDPYKAFPAGLTHTQRVLAVRIHNSTRAFVQCLIFGGAFLVFGAAYRKFDVTIAAVGALVGVGLVAFGVRSLVKSFGFRRELRRVNQGG
ncbi:MULTISPECIES: hypothetical protein [Streptomyces]|uniref:DUF202 domain-containing protein n=1 Tax=Streptomyces ramulosus TaxID=47762 RepID=A0ABW1FI64_9ACTN